MIILLTLTTGIRLGQLWGTRVFRIITGLPTQSLPFFGDFAIRLVCISLSLPDLKPSALMKKSL